MSRVQKKVPSHFSDKAHSHYKPLHFGRLEWRSRLEGSQGRVHPMEDTAFPPDQISLLYTATFSPPLLFPFHLRSVLISQSIFRTLNNLRGIPVWVVTSYTNSPGLTQTHRLRTESSTRLSSLQTLAPGSEVPKPLSLLTRWLQVQGFPPLPQVQQFDKMTHRTQESTIAMNIVSL